MFDSHLKVILTIMHRAGILQSVFYASRPDNFYWI